MTNQLVAIDSTDLETITGGQGRSTPKDPRPGATLGGALGSMVGSPPGETMNTGNGPRGNIADQVRTIYAPPPMFPQGQPQ